MALRLQRGDGKIRERRRGEEVQQKEMERGRIATDTLSQEDESGGSIIYIDFTWERSERRYAMIHIP